MHFWLFLRKNSDFLGQRKLWPVTHLFWANFNYKYGFSKTNLDIDKLRDFNPHFCVYFVAFALPGGAVVVVLAYKSSFVGFVLPT